MAIKQWDKDRYNELLLDALTDDNDIYDKAMSALVSGHQDYNFDTDDLWPEEYYAELDKHLLTNATDEHKDAARQLMLGEGFEEDDDSGFDPTTATKPADDETEIEDDEAFEAVFGMLTNWFGDEDTAGQALDKILDLGYTSEEILNKIDTGDDDDIAEVLAEFGSDDLYTEDEDILPDESEEDLDDLGDEDFSYRSDAEEYSTDGNALAKRIADLGRF